MEAADGTTLGPGSIGTPFRQPRVPRALARFAIVLAKAVWERWLRAGIPRERFGAWRAVQVAGGAAMLVEARALGSRARKRGRRTCQRIVRSVPFGSG